MYPQGKLYTFYLCHYSPVLLESLVFMVFWIGFENFDLAHLLPASSGDQDQTMGVDREAGAFVPRIAEDVLRGGSGYLVGNWLVMWVYNPRIWGHF